MGSHILPNSEYVRDNSQSANYAVSNCTLEGCQCHITMTTDKLQPTMQVGHTVQAKAASIDLAIEFMLSVKVSKSLCVPLPYVQ